jgi:hypothetical protein
MSFLNEYIKKPLRILKHALTNKTLLFIAFLDLIFYILLYLSFKIFAKRATSLLASIQTFNLSVLQDLNSVTVETANQIWAQLQTFVFSIISAIVIFALFLIVLISILKGFEWSRIVKNKLNSIDYVKLILLNLIWFGIWLLIFALPLLIIEREAYLSHIYYLVPFLLYFSIFLLLTYTKTNSIGKALKAPITQGIFQVHKYVSAIVIIIILFEVPFLALKIFRLNPSLHLLIYGILLFSLLAISKLYIYNISESH